MPAIPKNSAGKLRVFTYSDDIPNQLEDAVYISLALYDPKSLLIYTQDTPIHVAPGTYYFSLPAYLFLNPAPYTNPYLGIVTYILNDGTTESQAHPITVK